MVSDGSDINRKRFQHNAAFNSLYNQDIKVPCLSDFLSRQEHFPILGNGFENCFDRNEEHSIGYAFLFKNKFAKNNVICHISNLHTVRTSAFKMDRYTF